jgi:branched-chain amino acid transport system substrate-binding protein
MQAVQTPSARASGSNKGVIALLIAGGLLLLCALSALAFVGSRLLTPTLPAGPLLKIVSSLPMTGAARAQTQLIVNAMTLRLDQAGGRACGGKYTVRYEAWDDATEAQDRWDAAIETANANKAAADQRIVAYLGPFNSGAAKFSIPILDNAGPLVMISLGNNYPGLTKTMGAAPGEPDVYYPAGLRNYVRVTPADDVQGAVAARFIHDQLKANSVYILDDQEPYGQGIAQAFRTAAKSIGLAVLGRDSIDPNAADYKALMAKIAVSNAGWPPDAIYAAMLVEQNAAQVLKDKVAMMGDNTRVKYVGPTGIQYQAFIDAAGTNVAEGVYTSVAGLPLDKLPHAGQQFLKDYDAKYHAHLNEPYAAYGYEAMSVALAAIESVCKAGANPADRKAVRDAVFATRDFNGVLGLWSFDPNGDTSLSDMTFYQIKGGTFAAVGQFK